MGWLGSLAAALVIGCSSQPITDPIITPGAPLPPANDPEAEVPDASASPLIGTWRGVNTAFLPTIQTVTWRFSPDGTCSQTFLTITDGVELTETRACEWEADRRAATVSITRSGATQPVTFTLRYSFPAADVLRLDGNEYSRVG